jgi:hypothetical protein
MRFTRSFSGTSGGTSRRQNIRNLSALYLRIRSDLCPWTGRKILAMRFTRSFSGTSGVTSRRQKIRNLSAVYHSNRDNAWGAPYPNCVGCRSLRIRSDLCPLTGRPRATIGLTMVKSLKRGGLGLTELPSPACT